MTNKDIKIAQDALHAARYGVVWNGEMEKPAYKIVRDGYWVPWHVADLLLAGLKDDLTPNMEYGTEGARG